jgi:hypothetical protein
MRKSAFTIILALCAFCFSPILSAQQALSNDSVVKLSKAGLSDDLILSTIAASPGTYNTSAEGLIELKKAGLTDKVVAAIMQKATAPTVAAIPTPAMATFPVQDVQSAAASAHAMPRVFLTSQSKGLNQNAARDQSMEMSKDFERDCPAVKITIIQSAADYTVALNHIEIGLFVRDNQFQIADRNGDLISKTKEGGSASL